MNPRNAIITTALALGLVLASASAFAGPGFGRGDCGPCGGPGNAQAIQNLTPEKQALFDTIFKEYRTSTRALHNDFWAADLELQILANNANADPDRVRQIISTMKTLRTKMDAARDTFEERVEKEVGITSGFGFGFGMGCGRGGGMGHGRGAGPGAGGRGYGPCGGQDFGPGQGYGQGSCPGYGPGAGQGQGPRSGKGSAGPAYAPWQSQN